MTAVCLGLSAQAASNPAPKVERVVVVFKTHFDIGYTDMASNVVRRYRTTMIDDALKVVDQNRSLPPEQQFAWTLPGWPLSQIMADGPGQTPERKQRVQQAFKDGRFVVHALPFTLHTELLELEDLVRGLGFSSRLSREAGVALPRDAKMTDVPCHSWIMPTLLRHAGVDFLHLGCNAASRSPQVPRLFWWEGPDGSRLLTMYTAESYGTGLVPPTDWPYRTWLALIHTGDNHGPPTPDEVKRLLEEARQKLPGVSVRIGRLSDFADGIVAEKAAVPVLRGDMPDTWIHGPMCDPQGAKLAKNIRPAIGTSESLNTMLGAWGLKGPETTSTLARAYEQSLLYGEHTWGGALSWITRYGSGTKWGYGDIWRADHKAGRFQRLEDSWAEHTSYIEAARDLLAPVMGSQMQSLANAAGRHQGDVVIYNPLPWQRDGWVAFSPSQPGAGFLADPGKRGPGGEASEREMPSLVARGLPPMGYRVDTPLRSGAVSGRLKCEAGQQVIENEFFRVQLAPARGAISSLVDKRSKREWVDGQAAHGFGQYLYERFDSNQVAAYVKAYVKISADWATNELGKPNLPPVSQVSYRAASPRDCAVSYTSTPVSLSATLHGPPRADLPHAVFSKVTLYDGLPFLDLEITIQNKPADPWPEAGWICLPFKMEAPQFRLGRQASIVDPVQDIVPGANRHLFGINTGVAIFDSQGQGVGLCPMDNPLVSLDTPGCWKYSMDFVPKKPAVYVNLFNNQWTTNFRLWNQGAWTARIRLWTFDKYEAESSLITPSLEARYPLQAAVADVVTAQWPTSNQGLQLGTRGTCVTAFGPNPDGSGTLLRLWELAGQSGNCDVQLPKTMRATTAQPVDLRGRATGPAIKIKEGRLQAPLQAFAPTSLILP